MKPNNTSGGTRSSSSSSSRGPATTSARRRRVAWTVEEREQQGERKAFWHVIGSAFTNKDGSETVRLFALPLDGVVILRDPKENDESDGGR